MNYDLIIKNIIGLFLESISGMGISNILERIQDMNKDMQSDILNCINNALKKFLKNYEGLKWEKKKLLNYIKNNDLTIDKIEEMQLKDLIIKVFNGGKAFDLPDNWERDFYRICINEFSQKQNVSNYLLLMTVYFQREERKKQEEQKYLEYTKLSYLIQENFDTAKQEDLYEGLNFINNTFYSCFCDLAIDGCSQELLGIGYWLTNVYEYTSDYEKSVKIAHILLDHFLNNVSRIDKFILHKLIGCAYTLGIAKINDFEKKEKCIQETFDLFSKIDSMIKKWKYRSRSDYLFIMGLFYSNFAASSINRYDWEFKHDKDEKKYLIKCKQVLNYHLKSKKYREELNSFCKTSDSIIRLYQTNSNIAGIYYRLKEFEKSISLHKEVLNYWIEINDKTRAMMSKTYIIGNYIELWNFTNEIKDEELKECLEFLNECKEFYKNRDTTRYKNIVEKYLEVKETIKKLENI